MPTVTAAPPLQAQLAATLDAIGDLVRGLAEAEPLIHNPTRAVTFDHDRVSGSNGSGADMWPDPQLRQVWLHSQRCTATALWHLARAGHPTGWTIPRPDRPATLATLVRALTAARTMLAHTAHRHDTGTLTRPGQQHAARACDAILAAHRGMPAGLYRPPAQPTPIRRCTACGTEPRAEGRRKCWPCTNRTRKDS